MFPHNFINNQPPPLNAQNMNEIEQEIDKKANATDVYTKTEADNKFALKTAISDMATKTWVNAQGFIKSLAGYATEAWVEAKGYITSSALNPYRTSSDQDVIDTAIKNRVSTIEGKESGWDAKAEVSDIPTTLAELSGDATHRLVTDTEKTTWSGKADTSDIPTTLAELSEDSTHRVVTDAEKTEWSGKQDELESGTNIKTINHQSVLGSGNITISGGGGADYLTVVDGKLNIIYEEV